MIRWFAVLLFLVIQTVPGRAALPSRLILLLDGVSYRDMKALQDGISRKESNGQQVFRQGFHQGYFPVSRLVSTFPSISDPAWTEILGNHPPAGYQRTYFSTTEGSVISQNGITSLVEYERQMTGPMENDFRRVISYVFPLSAFKNEVNGLVENFLTNSGQVTNYYALIHSTDVAQHLSGDILPMLSVLDERLQKLRSIYREREGKELEILILSDHGNNHGGLGKRVAIKSFLKKAGYKIATSIQNPKDVVLPTAGIESWVEIHNSPAETERLITLLPRLEGVDVVTAQASDNKNEFIVVNAKGERAVIGWDAKRNAFRYSPQIGDPIGYRPVTAILGQKNKLDSDGFATADDWMAETLTHRYPLALERIVRGHTRVTINPASILISLKNDYVHCKWLIRRGVVLVKSGGTHGGLDDLNSNGIFLSSFARTEDTSTHRVGPLYDGFSGLRNYLADEHGAQWILEKPAAGAGDVVASTNSHPVGKKISLRIWTPSFARLEIETPIDVMFETVVPSMPVQIPRTYKKPADSIKSFLTCDRPVSIVGAGDRERVYEMPANLILIHGSRYRVSGQIRGRGKESDLFSFTFWTDHLGQPISEVK